MYNLHYFWAADSHSSSATMQNSMSHFFSFSQIVFSSKHLDSKISQSHLILQAGLHQRQPLKGQCSKKLKTLFDYSKNHAILQSMVNVLLLLYFCSGKPSTKLEKVFRTLSWKGRQDSEHFGLYDLPGFPEMSKGEIFTVLLSLDLLLTFCIFFFCMFEISASVSAAEYSVCV